MSSHYAKPETALMKSKDFIRIGKPDEALQCLHVMLHSRRYRQWTETHEQIMHSYIELAVGLQKNIKDALVMYQKICQTTQTQSLAKIMKRYADLSEAKAEEARKKAAETKEEVAENLELTPEMILAQLSGDEKQDRSDSEVLAPWVRYLWETYRAILDVLRNNDQLKAFYQEMCRAAFSYCRKFRRTGEFRRFVDLLRNHLIAIEKHAHQQNAVNLKDPITQRLYLETRFLQLEIAAELELWQDAYRTIEDIHDNMLLSDKPPEPHLMKTYYEKLAQIFWASDNALFHAYSTSQFYQLTLLADEKSEQEEESETKKAPEEEVDPVKRTALANSVLLATLCILPRPNEPDGGVEEPVADLENEGNRRLALLLGFNRETPTRANLLSEIITNDLLTVVTPFVREIYELTEKRFGPLSLRSSFEPLLAQVDADSNLKKYTPALKKLALLRLSQQLGSVFKTIRISKFLELTPPMGPIHEVERQLMLFVKWGHLNLRVDHKNQLFHFLEDGMENQRMKDQLSVLALKLQQVADSISPPDVKEKKLERKNVFQSIVNGVEDEHKMVFERMKEIERRKQRAEEIQLEKERIAAEHKRLEESKRAAEEKERLREEAEKREKDRIRKEQEKKDLQEKQLMIKNLKQTVARLAVPEKKIQKKMIVAEQLKVEEVDKQRIKDTETQLVNEAKKETERRRRDQSRRIEYYERALRLEEVPLLAKDADEREQREKEKLEEEYKRIKEEDRKLFDKAMEEKKRFLRMVSHFAEFKEKVLAGRRALYEVAKKEEDAKRKVKEESQKKSRGKRQVEEEEDEEEEVDKEEEEPEKEEADEEEADEEEVPVKKDKFKQQKPVEKEKPKEKEKIVEKEKPKEKVVEKEKEPEKKKEPEKEKRRPKQASEDEEEEEPAPRRRGRESEEEPLPPRRHDPLPRAPGPRSPLISSRRRGSNDGGSGRDNYRDRDNYGGGRDRDNYGGGRDRDNYGGRDGGRDRDGGGFRSNRPRDIRDSEHDRSRDNSPAKWRSGGRDGGRDGGGRDHAPIRREQSPIRRGGGGESPIRRGGGGGGRPERTPPPRRDDPPARQEPENEEDDGFTVVKRKKGGGGRGR